MYRVKVALDMASEDIGRLRPGMSARAVVLTAEAKGVVRVPLQSVLEREGSLEDAQKIALAKSQTHIAKHAQVIGCLNSLGHQLATKDGGNLLQGLDRLDLVALGADILDEVAVNLDDVGFEL